MRAVVFVNGVIKEYASAQTWLRDSDYLVAADGGTAHCTALGRLPHAIVGDLDSLDPQEIARLTARGVQFERHPEDKDQTDLELALEYALSSGADEILLLGALGGRLDQTLANLLILAQRVWPILILLAEGDEVAYILHGGETLVLQGTPGNTVSVVPLSQEVTGITYDGLRYPLTDVTLHFGSTRGISNEIVASPATIELASGMLLVIQEL